MRIFCQRFHAGSSEASRKPNALYSAGGICHAFRVNMKRFFTLVLACVALTGCSTTLTNLTPRQHTRNANGLYPVEVMWDSKQANIVKDTIKGYVIVGQDAYPMQRSPMLTNRWETFLPVPADKEFVNYRYKFDYEFLRIPVRQPSSKMSAPYQLQIVER
jgi:hypothetical protein